MLLTLFLFPFLVQPQGGHRVGPASQLLSGTWNLGSVTSTWVWLEVIVITMLVADPLVLAHFLTPVFIVFLWFWEPLISFQCLFPRPLKISRVGFSGQKTNFLLMQKSYFFSNTKMRSLSQPSRISGEFTVGTQWAVRKVEMPKCKATYCQASWSVSLKVSSGSDQSSNIQQML